MWERLINKTELILQRGYLLRFPASNPFEEQVVMMVSGYPESGQRLGATSLITITGYCAGINAYVVFPEEVQSFSNLSATWLIANWNKWVWPEGDVNDVFVREPLNAIEL